MNMEDESTYPKPNRDHILDWLEGSLQFHPSFMEDSPPPPPPYNNNISHFDVDDDSWWLNACQDLDQDLLVNNNTNSTDTSAASTSDAAVPRPPNNNDNTDLSTKKRKAIIIIDKESDHHGVLVVPTPYKKPAAADRRRTKAADTTNGNDNNNSREREGRWAEQLLNPCASAITSWNPTRVQHLIYVLHELASPTGDANHRLAAHGLRALTQHLSRNSPPVVSSEVSCCFSTSEPQVFQKSIMRFDEVSPWFGFPNKIANAAILQILSELQDVDQKKSLHILDIGVSHGVQWPTFLESLTRRPGGPPPLVRLTVVGPSIDVPFAVGPMGHNYSSRLLGFAESMKIKLQINLIQNVNSSTQVMNSTKPGETLIVCAQFRLHYLNHHDTKKKQPEEEEDSSRTEFLRVLRNLDPKGVIVNENNMDCSCMKCCGGDFAVGFSRKVDYLWRFLDSTSVAFKGRESEERRVMEGEAGKALRSLEEMNEGKGKWCERMRRVGFVGKAFSEETMDEGRALLRKYDSNWEMKVDERDGCVGLGWKGQPVSFCSLWTTTSTC